jgi:hypothetical protein
MTHGDTVVEYTRLSTFGARQCAPVTHAAGLFWADLSGD